MEQLSVSYIPIKDITPYENNPRHNEDAVSKVADSIREFGWQQPIVVDSNNVIIVGHTRYKAALELGMTQVPVHVADELSDEEVKAYRLVDNKTNEFAEWDFGKLQEELDSIEGIDMSQFGFDTDILDLSEIFTDDKPTPSTPKEKTHVCPYCHREFTEEQEKNGVPSEDSNVSEGEGE